MAARSSTAPPGWLLEAADRVCALAGEIRWLGLAHLVEDVQALARRRPQLLLLAATVSGVAAGRALRIALAEDEVEGNEQDGQGEDELEPAALDALLQRMWPG